MRAFYFERIVAFFQKELLWRGARPHAVYEYVAFERGRHNIEFAEKTGFDKFYLWGAEWWYWLKEKQGRPEIWDEARAVF